MKRIFTFTALVTLLTPGAAPGQEPANGPLDPIDVRRPPGGPPVVVRPQPEVALVAIRVAVRVEEPPEAAGAVRTLQRLARSRMEEAAVRYGASVGVARTATHAIYTVVGPAGAFDAYVTILTRALSAPDITPARLNTLRLRVEAEAAAHLDTPEPLLKHRLRELLFPTASGRAPDDGATRVTPESLNRVWSRLFRPERMQVVVAGAISAETAAAAFRGWPRGEGTLPPQAGVGGSGSASTPPEPQVLFPWVALGYATDEEPDAAVLAVAARLVEERLDDSFLRTAQAELWWLSGDRRALVLVGSASPSETRAFYGSEAVASGDSLATDSIRPDEAAGTEPAIRPGGDAASPAAIAQRLRSAVPRTAALLTPAEVARVRRELRRDVLFAARTPQGMATLLGEFLQRTGDPQAARRFLRALDRVDAVRVHGVLARLAGQTPASVEVTP